jgi:hypothetical protein
MAAKLAGPQYRPEQFANLKREMARHQNGGIPINTMLAINCEERKRSLGFGTDFFVGRPRQARNRSDPTWVEELPASAQNEPKIH